MMSSSQRNGIFVLTRGYRWRDFRSYKVLIERNRRIIRFLRPDTAKTDGWENFQLVIFHEGNISRLQQLLISIQSKTRIQFIDISNDFKLHPNNIWNSSSEMPLSYSLMCQFNYYHVWKYLKHFNIVCRIDEDVWMETFPSLNNDFSFITGAVVAETHQLTNDSFLHYLTRLNLQSFYDHRFPFTNFYVTKAHLWNDSNVSQLLFDIYSHPLSADHRWGDIPVLGVVFNSTAKQSTGLTCDTSVSYRHLSHLGAVFNGAQTDVTGRLI